MAAPATVPPAGGSSAPLPIATMVKLCVMMFLQFFIWGAWFEIGFSYIPAMKFNPSWLNDLVFNAFNFGALVALFFSTQFADRNFAAQKFLAFSHLIGGLAIGGLFFLQTPVGTQPGQFNSVTISERASDTSGKGTMPDGTAVTVENLTAADGAAKYWEEFDKLEAEKRPTATFTVTKNDSGGISGDAATPLAPFVPFLLLMLVHSIFYVPTISITNSIAFNAFTNPERQFGPVRVWGTIGWIAASWPFIFILVDWAAVQATGKGGVEMIGAALGTPLGGAEAIDGKKYVFLVAAIGSLVLAGFSMILPHTPPRKATGEDSLAWLKAVKLLRHLPILVLFIVTFIDAAVHQSYFFWTFDYLVKEVKIAENWAGAAMKIGQVAEILTMFILGWVLKSLGWKWTMVIGVLGHAARFAVFAYFPQQPPVLAVIALHGVCYAFFFATVYIFVDKTFPTDVRSSAQGLFNVLILGAGPFLANTACGRLKDVFTVGGKLDYPAVFQVSMFAALIAAALLVVGFHPKKMMEKV